MKFIFFEAFIAIDEVDQTGRLAIETKNQYLEVEIDKIEEIKIFG